MSRAPTATPLTPSAAASLGAARRAPEPAGDRVTERARARATTGASPPPAPRFALGRRMIAAGHLRSSAASLALYAPLFEGSRRVIDIGCAQGGFLELLERRGVQAVGVELDPDLAADARRRGLDVRCEDAIEYLRTTADRFDGVFCSHVIEHLPPETVIDLIENASRLVEAGGRLVLVTPNPESLASRAAFWRTLDHVRPYHRETLIAVLEHYGLSLVRGSPDGAVWRECAPALTCGGVPTNRSWRLTTKARGLRRLALSALGLGYCARFLDAPHDVVIVAERPARGASASRRHEWVSAAQRVLANHVAPAGRRRSARPNEYDEPARRRALRWLRAQETAPGRYRFSPHTPASLMGSACAALAAATLDRRELSRHRAAWIDHIASFQRADGWFDDPWLAPGPRCPHSAEYLRSHQTFLATMALDALGAAPRPLPFLDRWRDDHAVHRFIDALDWRNPWAASNWVQHVGYYLLYDAGLRPADTPLRRERWPAGFAGLLRWLTENIDPRAGFWGDPPLPEPARSHYLMAGAYHHYVFFYATGTPIPAIERVIDATLALRQPDGLFRPGEPGGGPCDDLDAIDILANMTRFSDHRRAEVLDALEAASGAIHAAQRPNGAFVWSCEPGTPRSARAGEMLRRRADGMLPHRAGGTPTLPGVWNAVTGLLRRCRGRMGAVSAPLIAYAGDTALRFDPRGGDMYSHWFRALALATAAQVLPRERRVAAWDFGFRDQVSQGWWPGSRRTATVATPPGASVFPEGGTVAQEGAPC